MTVEEIKKFDHIPTSEIKQDIVDTQEEIDTYTAEMGVLRLNPELHKVLIYMREGKISSRESFNEKLKSILKYRQEET